MSNDMLKVATFNANSIRARLEVVLDWMKREAPDVLAFQETKVQDKDFPVAVFQGIGYHVVFRGQKSYSGVAVASREEPEQVASGFGDGEEADEARLIRLVIRGVPIVSTYVPQGRSVDSPHFQRKLAWFERLRDLFDRDYSPDGPLLWMGDFNVAPQPEDVHDPKGLRNHVDFHPEARAALQRVREWGFIDVFRKHHPEAGHYTFWDYRVRTNLERNRGWRVDHIWATEPLARKSLRSWVDVEARRVKGASDHTFLVAEFAL